MIDLQEIKQGLFDAAKSTHFIDTRAEHELLCAVEMFSAAEGASQDDEPASSTEVFENDYVEKTKEELVADINAVIAQITSFDETLLSDDLVNFFFKSGLARAVCANGFLK